ATLGDLEAEAEAIKARAARRQREKEEADREADRLARNLDNSPEMTTGGSSRAAAGRSNRQMGTTGALARMAQRFGKRGPADEGAEEAMDLDYEDDVGVKTRNSRRKL